VKRRIIQLLLFFVAFAGKAQERECFSLFTDRDIYISGETALIKIFVPAGEPSGIVNVDLINAKGKIISGISKKIIDHQSDGFLVIPDSLSSGCYLLCVSTKINPVLTIKELYICNRFKGLPESGLAFRTAETKQFVGKSANTIQIEGIDKRCKTRSNTHVTLRLPAELLSQINGNLFVGIAETSPEYNSSTFVKNSRSKRSPLIEKSGVILEGIVTDLKTGVPFKKGVVLLSIPDTIPRFNYFITGEDGCFNFQLDNYYGKIPVVVQGYDQAKKRLVKVAIAHRDSLPAAIPAFEPWNIPPELRKMVTNNVDAATIRKIFNYKDIVVAPPPSVKADNYPYYGVPTEIIDPKIFIDLPDFTEVSRELLPGVKFRAYNRIPTLEVFNPATHNYFNDQPLLLLDGIPIHDLSVIKDMGSKEIDRIEVCRNERFYGDLNFPGVVAIYTSKRDYRRVNESYDLVKLTMEVLQPDAIPNPAAQQQVWEPDLRKVLLWKPRLKPEQTIDLDFKTSDILGSYKLIVSGKSNDGSVWYKEQIFEVN
jgi:hypothetical protein